MTKRHLLAVITRNSPGVTSRITGLLRRKLFNIDSLTVGRTPNPAESRFTVVIEGTPAQADKAAKLIDRLVEVREVKVLNRSDCWRREVVLARFRVKDEAQAALLKHAENEVLSETLELKGDIITMELVDGSQKLDTFLAKIQATNIEIIDWVRSGLIAMEK